MKTEQLRFINGEFSSKPALKDADLVLVFGESDEFRSVDFFEKVKNAYPQSNIIGCSSSGNIMSNVISHDDAVLTAVKFEKGTIRVATSTVSAPNESKSVGIKLARELEGEGLKHILIVANGLCINGSELADGFNDASTVSSSGGLAGDGTAFVNTAVIANAPSASNIVTAIGIYGDVLVKTGSFAGFDEFGVEKSVTKSVDNVVYEIDNEPALDMYKRYLGDEAKGLPLSGLYFPVSIKDTPDAKPLIRTLLAIDNDTKSITFAGTIKQGSLLKLMKSNIDNLVENAALAADAVNITEGFSSGLCIAVSCVGRMIIMKQLVEEELDEVKNKLPSGMAITGFYSYGELAPNIGLKECSLHNQTMTLTAIYE